MSGYATKVLLTAWSANTRYLATSAGAEIIVWDFGGNGPERLPALELNGRTDRIERLAFHPSGPYLASGGRDWRLALWLPGKAAQPSMRISSMRRCLPCAGRRMARCWPRASARGN